MTWVYIGCILLSVVTCVFLLNKILYFIDAGVFAMLLHVVACYLAGAFLILIFCGQFLGYVLVLFVITVMILAF
jgi:hypothetical protein